MFRDILSKMGVPKAIASDDGAEFKGEFKKILQAEGIEHIVFTTHLSFIDRFTRTIKNMLFERVEHTKQSWNLLLPSVIKHIITPSIHQLVLNLMMLYLIRMHLK